MVVKISKIIIIIFRACVKNGLSDPTKVQEGWDRSRNNVKSDHQGKALKEGCHERREAWTGVSSTENMNTKRRLN